VAQSLDGNLNYRGLVEHRATGATECGPDPAILSALFERLPPIGGTLFPVDVLREVKCDDYEALVVQVLHVRLEPISKGVHPRVLELRRAVKLQDDDPALRRLAGGP
jgi:hypothetical protein